jgi:hypothetical protein
MTPRRWRQAVDALAKWREESEEGLEARIDELV